MNQIRIGIAGYGNLGKGVALAVAQNPDMTLAAVFTRRDPAQLTVPGNVPAVSIDEVASWQDKIDVMIICGGSATDLPEQGPALARLFNVIDSFDTHAHIPAYFAAMDAVLAASGHTGVISVGWDPGLFSLNRLYMDCVLPQGKSYTFWGKGVSQGHSDAIRRVKGVKDGKQYTIPVEAVMEEIRHGSTQDYTTRQKHLRECFVVLEDGADAQQVEHDIVTMPNYFDEYDTTVHFITEAQLNAEHSAMPHGGFVIHSGETGENHRHIMEFSLKLDSNPEFTSSVLVCYARAAYRLAQRGEAGCKTVFDIAPGLLSAQSPEALRAHLL